MPLGNNSNSNTSQTTQVTESEETVVEQTVEEPVVEENLPDVNLIVENGSGVSDANSYCDLDYALEYCTMKGYTSWQSLSDKEQKIFLIRGTEFVDNFYTWKGRRYGQFQSLAFPRIDIYDNDGYLVRGIPDRLKKACIEAAFLNSTSGADTLFSTKDENGDVKKQKVDSLEVEYFSKTESIVDTSKVDYTTIYDVLNKLLKGLYKTKDDTGCVCTRAMYTGW